jgi:membrane protein implicated in regulation of membrane protease activity
MSERRAVTLVVLAMGLAAFVAGGLVVAVGGNNQLAVLAMILVGLVGADQISRTMMRYDRRRRPSGKPS